MIERAFVWNYTKGHRDDYIFTICEQKSLVIFAENGAIQSIWYGLDGDCESDVPSPSNGWYSINGNSLILTWQVDGDEDSSETWDNFEFYSNK